MAYKRTREIVYNPSEVVDVSTDIASTDKDYSSSPLRAITVGTAGTLKVDTPNTTGFTIPANALAVGVQHSMVITKVYNASTAAEIVGWR